MGGRGHPGMAILNDEREPDTFAANGPRRHHGEPSRLPVLLFSSPGGLAPVEASGSTSENGIT